MEGPLPSLILASVLSLQGGLIEIDKGLIDGIRVDDRGAVFYTLTVESRRVRIDVGRARIVRVADFTALARPVGSSEVRPGYTLELTVDPGRDSPAALLTLANERLETGDSETALRYFRKIQELLPGDPLVARKISTLEAELAVGPEPFEEQLEYYRVAARDSFTAGDLSSGVSYIRKILEVNSADTDALELLAELKNRNRRETMLLIPAGTHQIGVDWPAAEYYNQQPRHSRQLAAYWIDRNPVSARAFQDYRSEVSKVPYLGWLALREVFTEPTVEDVGAAVGVTFAEARAYCRSMDRRLATEFEWVAASRRPGFGVGPGISEWTDSWYKPYHGNTRPEDEYGETFRVVKGFDQDGRFDPQMRFFMVPAERSPEVGFRCAMDARHSESKP